MIYRARDEIIKGFKNEVFKKKKYQKKKIFDKIKEKIENAVAAKLKVKLSGSKYLYNDKNRRIN